MREIIAWIMDEVDNVKDSDGEDLEDALDEDSHKHEQTVQVQIR